MKTALTILLILIYTNAYSDLFKPSTWLKSKDPEQTEEADVQEEKPEPPKVCHFAIDVYEKDGAKEWYVFRYHCGELVQVGIIDEISKTIFKIQNLKKADRGYGYIGQQSYESYIKENFPSLIPLQYYQE